MEVSMAIEKYVVIVNKTCKECGYPNKIEYSSKDPIDIVACGFCGEVFKAPSGSDKGYIKEQIKDVLKGDEEDVVL